MNILAIDPGTHLGWASSRDGKIESGVQSFELGRGDSPGMRFLRFRAWFADMIRLTAPELIVYERPVLRFGYSAEILSGFVTRIQELCAERGIEFEAVCNSTLKKRATGSGRADKAAMIKAASAWTGRPIVDDNEADALCLLRMAKGGGK